MMHRYPGRLPFENTDRSVFFGREKEISDLNKFVGGRQLVVLYSKSGLGKTSLLNAGLIPELEENHGHVCLKIRFYGYKKDTAKQFTLLEKLQTGLINALKGHNALSQLLGFEKKHKITWILAKELQSMIGLEKQLLIVMDQAEEIFTYPEEQIEELTQHLSYLIDDDRPPELQQKIREPNHSKAFDEGIEVIYKASQIKFLLGIRSDKLSLLHRVKVNIPMILSNLYELSPLDTTNAELAIVIPSQIPVSRTNGLDFDSPEFHITEELLQKILGFLSHEGTKPMETFLLQLICSHMEILARRKKERILADPTQDPSQTITINSADDVPDLSHIISNYYVDILFNNHEKNDPQPKEVKEVDQIRILKCRYLIETILIDIENNYRISVDENYLESRGIHQDLLENLIKARFLRKTPNNVDGWNYELSHDTLIEAIRTTIKKAQLPSLTEGITQYYLKHVNNSSQLLIENRMLDRIGGLPKAALIPKERKLVNELIEKEVLREDEKGEVSPYSMFTEAAIKRRRQKQDGQVFWYKRGFYMAAAMVLIFITAVFLIIDSRRKVLEQVKEKNIAQEATKLEIKIRDSIALELEGKIALLEKSEQNEIELNISLTDLNETLESKTKEVEAQNQELADKGFTTQQSLKRSYKNEIINKVNSNLDYLLRSSIKIDFPSDSQKVNARLLNTLIDSLRLFESIRDAYPLSVLEKKETNELDSINLALNNPYNFKGRQFIENPPLLRKAIEGIKATSPEILEISNFSKEINSILSVNDHIFVATIDSAATYDKNGVLVEHFAFKNDLKNAGCKFMADRQMLYCMDQNASRIDLYSTKGFDYDSSIYLQREKFKSRISELEVDSTGVYILWQSEDLEHIAWDKLEDGVHEDEANIIGEKGVITFLVKEDQLISLYPGSVRIFDSTHHLKVALPFNQPTKQEEQYKRMAGPVNGYYLLLSDKGNILRLGEGRPPQLLKNVGFSYTDGLIANGHNVVGVFGQKEWKVFDQTIDDSPVLRYTLPGRENISNMVFHEADSMIILGTDEGLIYKIPMHTLKAHELLNLAVNNNQKP